MDVRLENYDGAWIPADADIDSYSATDTLYLSYLLQREDF